RLQAAAHRQHQHGSRADARTWPAVRTEPGSGTVHPAGRSGEGPRRGARDARRRPLRDRHIPQVSVLMFQNPRPKLQEVRDAGQPTIALVRGEAVRELPADLYIPPEALEVFLDTFEGPLDLLLYLIRRENLDILDVKVAQITEQYMAYIELMQAMQLELAGEYLLMAAILAEIKSR